MRAVDEKHGVNKTPCVLFASRRNGVPADSSEIFDFRDTRNRRFLGTQSVHVFDTGSHRGRHRINCQFSAHEHCYGQLGSVQVSSQEVQGDCGQRKSPPLQPPQQPEQVGPKGATRSTTAGGASTAGRRPRSTASPPSRAGRGVHAVRSGRGCAPIRTVSFGRPHSLARPGPPGEGQLLTRILPQTITERLSTSGVSDKSACVTAVCPNHNPTHASLPPPVAGFRRVRRR